MNNSSPTNHSTASSLLAGKITRKQVAAYCGLCVRTIDELTRTGVLGHFKIGKSIRYDLAEVEATLRERFHVRPAIHGTHTDAAAANAGTNFHDEGVETLDGGLRTSGPTSDRPASRRASARSITHSTTQA